jgi:hypothetical protein
MFIETLFECLFETRKQQKLHIFPYLLAFNKNQNFSVSSLFKEGGEGIVLKGMKPLRGN